MRIVATIGGVLGLALLAGGSYAALEIYSGQQGRQRAEALVDPLRRDGNVITLGPVRGELRGDKLVIRDVTVNTPAGRRLTIGAVRVGRYDWDNPDRPRFADVSVEGIRIDLGKIDKALRDALDTVKLSDVVIDARLVQDYDPKTGIFELRNFTLAARNWGTLTLAIKVRGWDPSTLGKLSGGITGWPSLLGVAGAQTELHHFQLRFEDKGAVEAYFRVRAALDGGGWERERRATVRALARMARRTKDRIAREALTAFADFLQKPAVLTAVVKPATPVQLGRLGAIWAIDPDGLKERLGLKVEAQ
jgi:hypothetical protein